METIMLIALGTVGLLALLNTVRKNEQVGDLVYLLVVLSLLMTIGELSTSFEYGNHLYLAAAVITLVFIASRLKISSRWWMKLVVSGIAFGAYILFGEELNYGEYSLSFNTAGALVLLGFAMSAPYIMSSKLHVFERYLGGESQLLKNSLQLFIVGFMFFLGSFLFALPGVFVVAVGFMISSFFFHSTWRNVSTALLLMVILLATMDYARLTEVDLSMGKVVMGLFFGAFLTVFSHAYSQSEKPAWWMLALSAILTFGLTFLVVFLGTQKADLGGADAFIGVLVGLVLALVMLKENGVRNVVVVSMLLGGFMAIPLTMTEVGESESINTKTTQVQVNAFDASVNSDINDLTGAFTIDPASFRLEFELGPKGGKTKGAFKDVKGEVEMKGDLSTAQFSVVLPIKSLTTFNKFRDESLMSDEYFKAETHNQLSFESNGMQIVDGAYELNGKFTMLGVVKDQKVQLKYLGEKEGKPVFVGKGSVDRREFGMRSDPKEGNIVDFGFEITLLKK